MLSTPSTDRQYHHIEAIRPAKAPATTVAGRTIVQAPIQKFGTQLWGIIRAPRETPSQHVTKRVHPAMPTFLPRLLLSVVFISLGSLKHVVAGGAPDSLRSFP